MNGIVLAFILILYAITTFYPIRFAYFYFGLGIVVLIQGIYGLVKGSSAKSIFPFVEKIAIYEKSKMGDAWGKQRKVSHISILLLSFVFFSQGAMHLHNSTGSIFQMDLVFVLVIVFFLLILMNVSMIFHFRKVDRSTSERDWKGYTGKTILLGLIFGIVFTILIISLITSYLLTRP